MKILCNSRNVASSHVFSKSATREQTLVRTANKSRFPSQDREERGKMGQRGKTGRDNNGVGRASY